MKRSLLFAPLVLLGVHGALPAQDIPLPGQSGAGSVQPAQDQPSGSDQNPDAPFQESDQLLIPLPQTGNGNADTQQTGSPPTAGGATGDTILDITPDGPGLAGLPQAPANANLVRLFPTWGQRDIEDGRLIIQGEEVNVGFDANLLAAPEGPTRLILQYQSGVDLLPERSRIEVIVNNRSVGALQLGAFNQGRRSEFVIPAGVLQRGSNEVILRGYQLHRVLCGPDAGWELWTSIDLARSGIAGARENEPTGQLSITQLGQIFEQITSEDRAIPVRFVTPPSSAGDIAGAIGLASWVGASLYHRSPVFEWVDGTPSGDVQILIDPTRIDPIGIQRTGSGRITITVGRIDSAGIITLLNDSAAPQVESRRTGASTGTVSAAELGLGDYDIRTHRSVYNLTFRLPSNVVIENDIRGDLILDAAYGAGMPEQSQFTFLVNGVPVRTRPLDVADGEIIDGERHPIPFNLLNGGLNTISIVTTIPAANPDAACPAIALDSTPFASIFNSTVLELPDTLPAIVYPELANFANAASPFSIYPGDAGVLATDFQSGSSVAAAMTLVGRLAATNGAPLNFDLASVDQVQTSRPTLVVAPVDRLRAPWLDLDPQLITAMRSSLAPVALPGADGDTVEDIVGEIENRVTNNLAASGPDVTRLTNAAPSSTSQRDWLELLGGGGGGPSIGSWFTQAYETTLGIVESAGSGIGLSMIDENLASWVAAQGRAAGMAIAYIGGDRQLITILTAADGLSLNAVARTLVQDSSWRQIGGNATILLADTRSVSGGIQVHTPVARRLFLVDLVEPESMRNLAGQLFSLDPALWFVVVFVLIVVGAALSHVAVRRMGVRTKDGN